MTGRLLLLAHVAGSILFYGNLVAAWLGYLQNISIGIVIP